MKRNIGVVGAGAIGAPLVSEFSKHFNVLVYDTNPDKRNVTGLNELSLKTQTIFVSLPTPMHLEDGSCDTSIVEATLAQLNRLCEKKHHVIIRSTVPPNKLEEFEKKYTNINLVYSPEFLREATSFEDFRSQKYVIFGGKNFGSLEKIYQKVFPEIKIYKTSIKTASVVKYFINCFLATKVSFANEIYEICEKLNVEYNSVKELVVLDERIGKSHMDVPSSSGKRFWGGVCFPKDLNSLMFLAQELGVETNTMQGAWQTNLNQPEEDMDWLKLDGRAISGGGASK